jgi:hypothetical protein
MRVHPSAAAATLWLVAVTALCATAASRHRQARARRAPPPEAEDFEPAPRHIYSNDTPKVSPHASPPAPESPRGELHVHVTGPHGLEITDFDVLVHRRGNGLDDWTLLAPEGADGQDRAPATFAFSTLEPGRYDVRVEAGGMRTVRVDDVPTGPRVVEIGLSRRPVLLGAVGDLGGPGCADVKVAWSGPGDDAETGEATLDADCTFFVEALPEDGPVTVTAKRGALEARALVTPPLSGDPGFLCLAPPCGDEPASLLVYVADTDRRDVIDASLTWTRQASDLEGEMGMAEGMSMMWVHGRRAGQTVAVRAAREGHTAEATTLLGPGVTELLLTLPAAPAAPTAGEVDRADVVEVDEGAD